MDDMNDKIKERWEQRRGKGSSWTRLIIMIIILVGILVAMNMLHKSADKLTPSQAEYQDSTAVTADTTLVGEE